MLIYSLATKRVHEIVVCLWVGSAIVWAEWERLMDCIDFGDVTVWQYCICGIHRSTVAYLAYIVAILHVWYTSWQCCMCGIQRGNIAYLAYIVVMLLVWPT